MGFHPIGPKYSWRKACSVCLWCILFFLIQVLPARAFVLMGLPGTNEVASFNYTDEFGAPKDISWQGTKRFFRWNTPSFVYSFDASFVNYFGLEGMEAVDDAFAVVNEFYVNEDYQGVSQLDLAKHGFLGNHNTTWINSSAENAQIIDIKSLVLGMLVNQLGLGNPHRWAFSITAQRTNSIGSQLIFETRLRNYDPITYLPADIINGVKYSYRLVTDATNATVSNPTFGVADMEEFTTDTSGNAWSSVAAITDAFYGNTSLYWTDTPSLFNFGVYYDGLNAMGGQYKRRHALTYDDAGGLKYLYSTNNFIYEQLPANVALIEPAQYLPAHIAVHQPTPTGRRLPIFPRRGQANFTAPNPTLTTTFGGLPGLGTNQTGIMDVAMRGGIDKIQFHHQPFDSLLGINFTPTNFIWMDTFVYQPSNPNVVNISDGTGRTIGTINNERQGIQWLAPNANTAGANFWQRPTTNLRFLSQKVGREVVGPDLVFVASDLGLSADGVPIGWQRPTNVYVDLSTLNMGFVSNANAGTGPGIIDAFGGNQIVFNNSFSIGNVYEVFWSGETSVVGNQEGLPSLWGWIKGPGPNDVVAFPQSRTQWIVENSVVPDVGPPTITMVSDDGGEGRAWPKWQRNEAADR